jgi:alkylation response protein AidB-like acyl-CoA dehydrogenase
MEARLEFVISEEQRLVAETVREFARDVIQPNVREWDEAQTFPDEVMQQIADLGFLGGFVPEEYGGAGLSTVEYATVIEEMARIDPSVTLSVAAHNSLCTGHVLMAGNEEQKRRWLPKLATGEWIGAWGLTEPQAGSDAAGTRATAEWDEGRSAWVINGVKTFNTNGKRAALAVVHAVTSPDKGNRGISAFGVETDRPGFQVGRKEDKLGCRASDTVELILENVEVPADNLIGERDEGFVDALRVLDAGRISIAALSVGLAQGALDACRGYVRERHQFGRAIGSFPAIQAKLVKMATEIQAARCLMWKAAALKDAGEDYKQAASMAKLYASETAVRTSEQAVQVFGGYGFVKDYPVEKLYRDAKLCTIGEGTSEMQRLVISRELLRG